MKRIKLDQMTVAQLVERFTALAIEQDGALLGDDIASVNRLYDQLKVIENELKGRRGDQRHALVSLYQHPNMQVRVKAAKATLAVAPQAARQCLQDVQELNWQPQALEAGMSLWNLERGVFKPT
jgi:enoyl reductase-like protein